MNALANAALSALMPTIACAVEVAINNAFIAAVFDPRPELSPQR